MGFSFPVFAPFGGAVPFSCSSLVALFVSRLPLSSPYFASRPPPPAPCFVDPGEPSRSPGKADPGAGSRMGRVGLRVVGAVTLSRVGSVGRSRLIAFGSVTRRKSDGAFGGLAVSRVCLDLLAGLHRSVRGSTCFLSLFFIIFFFFFNFLVCELAERGCMMDLPAHRIPCHTVGMTR